MAKPENLGQDAFEAVPRPTSLVGDVAWLAKMRVICIRWERMVVPDHSLNLTDETKNLHERLYWLN